MPKSLTAFVLLMFFLLVSIPTNFVQADPSLPLPRMPICGDQDDPGDPITLHCDKFNPVIDIEYYQVPSTGTVTIRIDFVFREATYNNELGFFIVDDQQGTINGLKPGEAGYYSAAYNRATKIFASGSNAYTPDFEISLTGGEIIAFYIVQNNSLTNAIVNNPNNEIGKSPKVFFSITKINPDNADHFVGYASPSNGLNQFGFEDMTSGGDLDFDDVVYNISPPLNNSNGFLDIPLEYQNAYSAYVGYNNGGYVTSWLDHTSPNLTETDLTFTPWYREYTGGGNTGVADCNTPPGGYGISCYNGHNGIDYSHVSDIVYAAGPGRVLSVGYDTGGLGNYIYIDHDNCYATLYAHLRDAPKDEDGKLLVAPMEIKDRQQIGFMGGTPNWDVHLHFSVFYDPNCDDIWTDRVVVDPYGYSGIGDDPLVTARNNTPLASVPNGWLWEFPQAPRDKIDNTGGSISSIGLPYSIVIPPGALSSLLTFELLPSTPYLKNTPNSLSTGYSFWLRVLEWLPNSSDYAFKKETIQNFSIPISVSITFDPSRFLHFDTNTLKIYQWDEILAIWSPLETTINSTENTASAQSLRSGSFDLEGAMVCPNDTLEINDTFTASRTIPVNGEFTSSVFDISEDEDWFKFNGEKDVTYDIATRNLTTGVDTVIEIYDTDGHTLLEMDDNSGGGLASLLRWRALSDGVYFIRVIRGSGSAYGCNAKYVLSVQALKPSKFFKTSPSNNSTNRPTTLTISWKPTEASIVTRYEYCFDTINDGECNTNWISTETNTSAKLSNLSPSRYYWQVRALHDLGVTYANDKAWWSFTVLPLPSYFSKSYPINGAKSQPSTVTLKWQSSVNAIKYQYCIDQINDNKCNTSWKSVGSNLKVVIENLTPGLHFWQVRAINSTGTKIANNGKWWSFTIK